MGEKENVGREPTMEGEVVSNDIGFLDEDGWGGRGVDVENRDDAFATQGWVEDGGKRRGGKVDSEKNRVLLLATSTGF